MKKAVAFLLAFLIFVTPVTTLVKADVVIGDNDETIVNENATILGRKLAMLESLSELALSGVTEYSISNTEDVDSYLDSLWSEINDAIDYLDSGEWVEDIPSNLASKYFTNLVKYRDIVNNRGEFLGFDLQNPATSLLKTYFANDIYGKKYTSTYLYGSLDTFRALSDVRGGGNTPEPNPDINYASYLATINNRDINGFFWYMATDWVDSQYKNGWQGGSPTNYSWVLNPVNNNNLYMKQDLGTYYRTGQVVIPFAISDLYIISTGNDLYSLNFSGTPIRDLFRGVYNSLETGGYFEVNKTGEFRGASGNNAYTVSNTVSFSYSNLTLEQIFINLTNKVRNVNIYVDGVPWSIVGSSSSSTPTLDVDGYIKIYGNDRPQQYQLQPNTQIDYDQLYQVIYNAIRDNLPISQGDINYYDSHDTIYSPTIINNYGEEEGDESDLIDTILDYAVIPKFDTAIAQPMRVALTNGVVIMNSSITNVIPNEILLILGACFFLLLFAVVINRMIK